MNPDAAPVQYNKENKINTFAPTENQDVSFPKQFPLGNVFAKLLTKKKPP